jgi:hypothetical protein
MQVDLECTTGRFIQSQQEQCVCSQQAHYGSIIKVVFLTSIHVLSRNQKINEASKRLANIGIQVQALWCLAHWHMQDDVYN